MKHAIVRQYGAGVQVGASRQLRVDAGVQIQGGSGYALEAEPSRILCDARILGVIEGSSEIQAHVIGRSLLHGA